MSNSDQMDEWVDVLDHEGKETGERILKSEAHRTGVFHPTVHIWLYTDSGEVLLQQRSKTKETFPLCWDVSVAGHIAAGENVVPAAVREIREEIGLVAREKDLIPIGIFKSIQKHANGITDCEFHHTFLCGLHHPISSLTLQEDEVQDIRLISLEAWEKELFDSSYRMKYVPHDPKYYKEVIQAIRNRITTIG